MWCANLDRMVTMFGPDGPACPREVRIAWDIIKPVYPTFAALHSPVRLPGVLSQGSTWFGELAVQHNCFYYCYLTGIPQAVINACIDPNWAPPAVHKHA